MRTGVIFLADVTTVCPWRIDVLFLCCELVEKFNQFVMPLTYDESRMMRSFGVVNVLIFFFQSISFWNLNYETDISLTSDRCAHVSADHGLWQ